MHTCNFIPASSSLNMVEATALPDLLVTPTDSENNTTKEASPCAICNGIANCRHFGAFSCNACAAFFRRTVSKKKNYACAHEGNCVIDAGFVRHICRACRMKKCLSAGMQKSEVLSLGLSLPKKKRQSNQNAKNMSQMIAINAYKLGIQKFNHTSYFSSHQNSPWLNEVLLLGETIKHQRMSSIPSTANRFNKPSFIPDLAKHTLNESRFCRQFLSLSGIMDMASDVVTNNLTELIFHWTTNVMIMNTIQLDSLDDKKLGTIDYSTIEMTESSIRNWYATEPQFVKHLDLIVRNSLPMWNRIVDISKIFCAVNMTKEETICLLTLSMIDMVNRKSDQPKVTRQRFKPFLDTVFRSMKLYYEQNFSKDCIPTRMGQLIMLLSLMNEVSHLFAEHRALLALCNWDPDCYDSAKLIRAFHSKNPIKIVSNGFYIQHPANLTISRMHNV